MRRCRASLRRAAAAALAGPPSAPLPPCAPPALARGGSSLVGPASGRRRGCGGAGAPSPSTLPRAASLLHRRSMFIQTAPTPNPASLMFLPGAHPAPPRPR